MKKTVLKKFAAAALAAATVMSSMSVMAFADDVGATANTGSVTITKYMGDVANDYENIETHYGAVNTTVSGEKLNNVKFAYIEVGDREQVEVNKDGTRTTEMLYTLTDAAAKKLEVTADVTEATGIKYYRMSTLDTAIRNHKNEAIDLVKNASENHAALTATDGTVKFTALSLEKLYLFAETDASGATKVSDNTSVAVTKVSVPFFVSLPFTDASGNSVKDIYAYPKNSTGEENIDKTINKVGEKDVNNIKANANIGDIITYKVTYSVPVPENGLAALQIVDTMSEGLTFTNNKDNIKVVDDEYQKTSNQKELVYGTDYEVTKDGKVVTINFNKYLSSLEKNSTEKFTITYKVKLNDKAVLGQDGNKNSVKLQYKNDVNDKFKDVPGNDDTTVFTYGIDLLKKGEGTNTVLKGVKFELTDESNTAVNVEKKEQSSFYTPGGSSNEVTTDANGRIYIRGLKPGTYKLTETKTNAGYVLLKNPVVIEITEDSTTATPGVAKATVGEGVHKKEVTMNPDQNNTTSLTAEVPLTVVNSKGFDLPATGGRGIALFTIAGIAIVAAAGSLLFMRKRSK